MLKLAGGGGGGGYQIDSFFDVFTELSVDGGQSFVPAFNPTHLVSSQTIVPEPATWTLAVMVLAVCSPSQKIGQVTASHDNAPGLQSGASFLCLVTVQPNGSRIRKNSETTYLNAYWTEFLRIQLRLASVAIRLNCYCVCTF